MLHLKPSALLRLLYVQLIWETDLPCQPEHCISTHQVLPLIAWIPKFKPESRATLFVSYTFGNKVYQMNKTFTLNVYLKAQLSL